MRFGDWRIAECHSAARLLLVVCLMAAPMAGTSKAEFWYEDFTDGNFDDAGLSWEFTQNHAISLDGLRLSSEDTGPTSAQYTTELREGWSIRTQAHLLQDDGFFGAATANAGFNAILADGRAGLGSVHGSDQRTDGLETNLRPFTEDVIVQLDTFDGVLRMWAWREGEQPEEDIAPLLEEDSFNLTNGAPMIWARSVNGPSSAMFSWVAISTEHMPVNMIVPASDLAGDIDANGEVDFADFLVVSANFGTEVNPPGTNGDLNGDGTVDFPDFLILSENFGRTEGTVAAVPEPAGLVMSLCAAGIMGLASRRRPVSQICR